MELRKLAVSPSELVCCMLDKEVAVSGEGGFVFDVGNEEPLLLDLCLALFNIIRYQGLLCFKELYCNILVDEEMSIYFKRIGRDSQIFDVGHLVCCWLCRNCFQFMKLKISM